MKTYWNIDKNLTVLNEWQPNCWIQVTCPTDEDQRLLEEEFKIPDYFLSDISDTDERARYEYDDGWMLIILRIPYVKEIRSRTPYTTVPLGIIHKRDVTITVCYYETNMMIDFVSYQQKRSEGFTDYVDMTFRLFLSSAVWYLKRLKQINSLIEKAKRNLDHGVNNESLIGLSRLQDSLTYFITSIRGNENLLSKLKFKLQVDELDADLIEIQPMVFLAHDAHELRERAGLLNARRAAAHTDEGKHAAALGLIVLFLAGTLKHVQHMVADMQRFLECLHAIGILGHILHAKKVCRRSGG